MTSIRGPSRRLAFGLVWATVVGAVAPQARPDHVVTAQESYPKVAVIGCTDGDLLLRLPDGSTKPLPLVEATTLVIDTVSGLADFNEAERYLAQQRLADAASRYERALRLAEGFWPTIIHHRLVQVYDGLGKFDRAVAYFVKVADDSPTAAARLMPRAIPNKRSGATKRALQRLAAEAKKAQADDRRALMELLSYAVLLRIGDPALDRHTESVLGLDIPPSIATGAVYAVKIAALDRLFTDGAYDRVLTSVEAIMDRCPHEVLPDLLLLKGRALFEAAASRQEFLGAGLALMRVVIHFPSHDLAPEALFWAAKVHERIERPRKAIQLLDECLAHQRTSQQLRVRARADRDRLAAGLAG